MLYMFRTVLVHHQEQLYKLYIAFGICRYMPVPYVWLLCGYTKCDVQLIVLLLMMDQYSPKHVEHLMEKIKFNHRNLCIMLVYIHISVMKLRHRLVLSNPSAHSGHPESKSRLGYSSSRMRFQNATT